MNICALADESIPGSLPVFCEVEHIPSVNCIVDLSSELRSQHYQGSPLILVPNLVGKTRFSEDPCGFLELAQKDVEIYSGGAYILMSYLRRYHGW